MSDKSAQKAKKIWHQNTDRNEASFLINFLAFSVIKDNRHVQALDKEGEEDRDWLDDGVLGVWSQPFISDCMGVIVNAKNLDKMSSDPAKACAIPVPDISYGLVRSEFNPKDLELMEYLIDLYQVCPELISVFFFIEGKSFQMSINYAEVQTQRGGSGLTCAQRQIHHLLDMLKDENGVDKLSRVFSLALDNNQAWLNVHWITYEGEGDSQELYYRHHRIRLYHLQQPADVEALRRDIWNIMEWGYTEHKTNVMATLEKLRKVPDISKLWSQETDADKTAASKRAAEKRKHDAISSDE